MCKYFFLNFILNNNRKEYILYKNHNWGFKYIYNKEIYSLKEKIIDLILIQI